MKKVWGVAAAGALLGRDALSASGARASSGATGERATGQLTLREIARRELHHGEGVFLNPFSTRKHGNLWKVLRWKLLDRNRFRAFYDQQPTVQVRCDAGVERQEDGCSITFIKHACVMIRDAGRVLLVDPMFFGLIGFHDYRPLAFDPRRLPAPDHVLITHGPYDHLDISSLAVLPRDTHVVSPLGYDGVFDDLGMSNRSRLDWYESYHDGKREIMLLPCNHWTMRNPLVGPNRSLWGSYLLKGASGFNIFISGDAAYFDHFAEIGRLAPIDLAIFNLGAYEPRWFMASSHMNPQETVRAMEELGAKRLMIVHWGTFRLGDEPVHFPPRDIRHELERRGMLARLVHLEHGSTYRLGDA